MKAGEVIASKYELVSRVGQGGMGAVWRVANLSTGREFAIKFLHAAVATGEDARQRFVQEARASARINHPNIIDIFDVGETDDGTLYLVMELLDGISLGEALRSEPPFSVRDLLLILAECCTALAAAHAAGVIHRDVKPPNLFLHRDRGTGFVTAKVLDFGVSKVLSGDDGVSTHTGSLLGSPRYMSPEQAHSAASADGRSDIWSLGVVLFEALTGRFPHDGDSSNNLIVAIATRPPKLIQSVAPQLPIALRMLIDDCLKPLEQRVPSAEVLLDRILTILATHDLADIPLARPTIAKGKSRVRPESFMLRTSPDSIPGLATSMMRARALGQNGELAAQAAWKQQQLGSEPGLAVPRPSHADLSFGTTSAAETPRLVRAARAQSEDATLVHMISEPSTDTYRRPAAPIPAQVVPTQAMPTQAMPMQTMPTQAMPMQAMPMHGSPKQTLLVSHLPPQGQQGQPQLQSWGGTTDATAPRDPSQVGTNALKRTIRLDDSAPILASVGAQRASHPGGAWTPQEGAVATPSPRDSYQHVSDPMVESISSINVARGPELAHLFDASQVRSAPPGSAAAKTPALWAILAGVAALAAVASTAVIVSYTRGSSSAAARSSAETASERMTPPRDAKGEGISTSPASGPSAAPALPGPAVVPPTAESATPNGVPLASSSDPRAQPDSSAHPTSVTELPTVVPERKPKPVSGKLPQKQGGKSSDPLKNLGSGLGP